MKTSLNDIQTIEGYLLHTLAPEDSLVMEARSLLDPQLKEDIRWQQKTYALIQLNGRRQLKAEIEKVHQHLFSARKHKNFSKQIRQLFTKP